MEVTDPSPNVLIGQEIFPQSQHIFLYRIVKLLLFLNTSLRGKRGSRPVLSTILSTSLLSLDPQEVAWLQQRGLGREDPLALDLVLQPPVSINANYHGVGLTLSSQIAIWFLKKFMLLSFTCSRREEGRQARSLLLVKTLSSTLGGRELRRRGFCTREVTAKQGRRARNQGSSMWWSRGRRDDMSRWEGRVGWTVST